MKKAKEKVEEGVPVRTPTISPSQLDAMGCRLAWFWGYKEGYKPRRSSTALELGSGIHYGLERYYGFKEHPAKAFEVWADKRLKDAPPVWDDDKKAMEEMRVLGKEMLEGYYNEYDGRDAFVVLATEQVLNIPLPTPKGEEPIHCNISLRLDGLIRDKATDKLFSLEHKSFSKISPPQLVIDQQFTAQVWAGRSLSSQLGIDEPISGVLYNGLRKQLPGPKVKLALFERHFLSRNDRQIEVFLHRAYHQVKETQSKPAIYPQPNPIRCSQCDFLSPCTAYQRGEDWKFILREMYSKRGEAPKQLSTIP